MQEATYTTKSFQETIDLGISIGKNLKGGEVFEFVSDLGGGKTTFVSGLSRGFGSSDPVASPSFTINYVYSRPDKKQLFHFDFYRLDDAGVVASELAEVEGDPDVVVAVEWGDIVHDVLPKDRIVVAIKATAESDRSVTFRFPGKYKYLFQEVQGLQS